jgi:predicted metalloendopeptidase
LTEYAIPGDRATDGAFRSLFDRAEEQVRDLITEAAPPVRRRAPTSSASATCTPASSTSRRSSHAACSRCATELALIDAAADADALAAVVGSCSAPAWAAARRVRRHRLEGLDALPGARDAVRASACPTSRTTATSSRDPPRYPGHIARMFALVFGDPGDHAATAERIVALETHLAQAHWDVVKRRDAEPELQPAHVRRVVRAGTRIRLGRLDRRAGRLAAAAANSWCASPTT